MAGAASAHQAATATREDTSQQRAGRTRRTSADTQQAQQGATAATTAAPAALDSLSRLQQLADASPQVAQLRRLQALADRHYAPVAQLAGALEEEEPVQGQFASAELPPQRQQAPRANNTGLPDQLKSGIESLSGLSMDHVRVHYNSSQPAQLNALAYAQGSDIHLAPGREQHLPHEAWHVVQQAQGRVRPTLQLKDGVPVNDDVGLEREADVMGGRALQTLRPLTAAVGTVATTSPPAVQRFLDFDKDWSENQVPPVGIPARQSKDGNIEITPDLGMTWEIWNKELIPLNYIKVYPEVVAAHNDRQELAKIDHPILANISSCLEPYERVCFMQSLASSKTGMVPTIFPEIIINNGMFAEFQNQAKAFLNSLSPLDLFSLRLLSKSHRKYVDSIIWRSMTIKGFSSFSGKMMDQVKGIVDETADFIKIASDQVDIEVVENLLNGDQSLQKIVKINYGQNLENGGRMGDHGVQPGNVKETQGPTADPSSKMHNKFMVQSGKPELLGANPKAETVTTGSANITFSGQNLNTESVVSIKNPLVAAYFNHYFGLIRGRVKKDDPQGKEFAKHLNALNQEGNPVRMAMEPFLDINAFVESELQGADNVVARMYVIDQNGRAIDALCQLATQGVPVTMVVDVGQYDAFIGRHKRLYYVRDAIDKLKKAGVTVYLQKSPSGKIMHDKMILAHYPESMVSPERGTVMIGSSGFTKNVREHKNYENMVAIDDRELYKYFMEKHHQESMNRPLNWEQ